MQLTIDNLDGLGVVDYTAAIDASTPFEILRTLNAPTLLKGLLCLAASTAATPARRARVIVTSDAGATLFTGYLATEPEPVYAGAASQGPVYRLALSAVSDEWLLDKQSSGAYAGLALSTAAGSLLQTLANRIDRAALSTHGIAAGRAVGVFTPVKDAAWSAHAGALADASLTAYSALNGALTITPLTATQHALSDGDGTLSIATLKTSSVRELANDVTVTGADEPRAYWTELFTGDGTTAVFPLLGEPAAPSAGHSTLIVEPFNQPVIDPQRWQIADPGSYLALSGAGLAFTGGNGLDGQTTLTAWDPLELGGAIVLELGSVSLASGSAGVLGGLYSGLTLQANCFAGFNIRQSGGTTIATPLVHGVEAGASLTILPGHAYTLRIHLHSPELLRMKQSFYALAEIDGTLAVNEFGGGGIASSTSLVFEARDQGVSSNTPVTILYDGAVASSPAQVSVVAVNSLALSGSLGSIDVATTGSCWITSPPTTGAAFTRLAGRANDGAGKGLDCTVTSSADGKVTFFPGRIPAPGETIAVSYRGRQRAVARLASPSAIASEAAGGAVGTARWIGHVVSPPARSQEDCENAAAAILSFSADRAAALSGSYAAINPPTPDIFPGDVLALTTEQGTIHVVTRRVSVSTQGSAPEALLYRIGFANDWAEGLGLKLSESLPADTLLPATALDLATVDGSEIVPVHTLANLNALTIAGPTGGFLAVDAGLVPPTGGGFEVRRRDGGFGVGIGSSASGDLVLRSPVRAFSIPVATTPETFYIRMYDASSPPLYSRQSAAIVCHIHPS